MFELLLQGVAVGFEAVIQVAVEVVLEQVDQDVEDAFLHSCFPGSLRQKTPAVLLFDLPLEFEDEQHRSHRVGAQARPRHERVDAGRLEAERI